MAALEAPAPRKAKLPAGQQRSSLTWAPTSVSRLPSNRPRVAERVGWMDVISGFSTSGIRTTTQTDVAEGTAEEEAMQVLQCQGSDRAVKRSWEGQGAILIAMLYAEPAFGLTLKLHLPTPVTPY